MGSHSGMSALKLLTVLIIAGVAQAALPRLDVYYESLCPYSRQFIREEVFPAYGALSDYFDVFFIAYGNADTTGDMESGFSIECQHGERECVGNVVQACTVKYQPDMRTQVYLMNCMAAAGRPEEPGGAGSALPEWRNPQCPLPWSLRCALAYVGWC